MPASPLSRLFDPRAIAVVGASSNEEKPGYQILRALEPFHGAVYPVNPRGGEILGHPVHRSLADVPGPVDSRRPRAAGATFGGGAGGCGGDRRRGRVHGERRVRRDRRCRGGAGSGYRGRLPGRRTPASRAEHLGIPAALARARLHLSPGGGGAPARSDRDRRAVGRDQPHVGDDGQRGRAGESASRSGSATRPTWASRRRWITSPLTRRRGPSSCTSKGWRTAGPCSTPSGPRFRSSQWSPYRSARRTSRVSRNRTPAR